MIRDISVFTAIIQLSIATDLSAATLIQCPDWKSLVAVEANTSLRKSGPKTSFEKAIAKPSPKKSAVTKPTSGPIEAWLETTNKGNCPQYKVRKGDTLSKIASAQLGSQKRWKEILTANRAVIKNENSISVGSLLTLPCAGGTTRKTSATPKIGNGKQSVIVSPLVPLPIWSAKSGQYVTDVVAKWGKKAGYKVIREGVDDWQFNVPFSTQSSLEDALKQLAKGFEGTGRPLQISIYTNKVIKIGKR